jgi:hypothetical protein
MTTIAAINSIALPNREILLPRFDIGRGCARSGLTLRIDMLTALVLTFSILAW